MFQYTYSHPSVSISIPRPLLITDTCTFSQGAMKAGAVMVASPSHGSLLALSVNKLDSDELRLKADILRSRPQTEATCKMQTSLPGTLNAFDKKLLLEGERAAQSSTLFHSRASAVLSSLLSLPDSARHACKNSYNCCSVLLVLILFWMTVRSSFSNHSLPSLNP